MANILIADDAKFMQTMVEKILEKHGHNIVAFANNGKEAIKKYDKHRPDLVTMDITMPSVSGIEATEKILEIDPNANIIMCSAMGQKPMVLEAIEAGAKTFIVKPIKEDKLIESIEEVLS